MLYHWVTTSKLQKLLRIEALVKRVTDSTSPTIGAGS